MSLQSITRPFPKFLPFAPSGHVFRTTPLKKAANKKKDPFASALAHEVRNPLSNINLAVEMLKSTKRDIEQDIYLDIIARNSRRITDLVSDLLASYDAREPVSKEYSIDQLIEEVLTQTRDRILLKNIQVRKDYSTVDCKVKVNCQQMKIALTNIIINAIDAMPPENGKLKLVTKAMNGKCVLEIGDNGSGISQENLSHIFEPYFTGKPGGMGLGLSTTLDILQMNHVKPDVKSEKGRGTRFTLTFDRHSRKDECLGA